MSDLNLAETSEQATGWRRTATFMWLEVAVFVALILTWMFLMGHRENAGWWTVVDFVMLASFVFSLQRRWIALRRHYTGSSRI